MSNKFFKEFQGFNPDELVAYSNDPMDVQNVNVDSDATIQRGMLLASPTFFGTYHLATAADVGKVLRIARDDFTADSDCHVTQVYSSGRFHREKIITADSDTAPVELFESDLRRQDIRLTALK